MRSSSPQPVKGAASGNGFAFPASRPILRVAHESGPSRDGDQARSAPNWRTASGESSTRRLTTCRYAVPIERTFKEGLLWRSYGTAGPGQGRRTGRRTESLGRHRRWWRIAPDKLEFTRQPGRGLRRWVVSHRRGLGGRLRGARPGAMRAGALSRAAANRQATGRAFHLSAPQRRRHRLPRRPIDPLPMPRRRLPPAPLLARRRPRPPPGAARRTHAPRRAPDRAGRAPDPSRH